MPTLNELKMLEQEYIKAEIACLQNQNYTIKDRTFTRADLNAIRTGRERISSQIAQMTSNGAFKIKRFVLRD